MPPTPSTPVSHDSPWHDYARRLGEALRGPGLANVGRLADALARIRDEGRAVYLCGNGGSAANAIHLANDFVYGAGGRSRRGLRAEALPANAAVLTCLGNDLGYEETFAAQLRVKAQAGDVLIILSGSGNSPNVVKALQAGAELGMETFAVVAFDGGRCREIAGAALHFPVHDMQVAEDIQLAVGHMVVQWLAARA